MRRAVHLLCLMCLLSVLCFDNKGLLVLSTVFEAEAEAEQEQGLEEEGAGQVFYLAYRSSAAGLRGMVVGERAMAAAKTAVCVCYSLSTHTENQLLLAHCSVFCVIKGAFKGLTPTLKINVDALVPNKSIFNNRSYSTAVLL